MAVLDEDDIDRLIGLAYEAGQDAVRWDDALEALRVAFRGTSAIIHRIDRRTGLYDVVGWAQLSQDIMAPYGAHWSAHDPWTRACAGLPAFRVATGAELVPLDALRRSAFHAEYLRPVMGVEEVIGGIGLVDGATIMPIGIQRGVGLPLYEPADSAAMQRLLPHLARAVGLHDRLRELRAERADLAAALDQIADCVILTTADGRVVAANRSARRLHRRSVGLTIDARLVAARPAQNARLRALLDRVAASGVPDALRLPVAGGGHLQIVVAPLPPQRCDARPAQLVAIVTDEAGRRSLPVGRLAALFGLTRAEAEVALALAEGERTDRIAAGRGVTLATLRTQIRAILAKTETARLIDLVRVISATPRLEPDDE
ncbi:MAG: PAS domain-containing protein [Alphaproteobacteria bacterium]